MQFGDGPSKHQVIALESIGPRARFGMITVTATAPDGTPVPPRHSPSPWPGRFALATSNPDVAEVLEIYGRPEPPGWSDLYKIHEIIRDSIKPQKIPDLGWGEKATDSAFTASANLPGVSGSDARHARMAGTPKHTMTIDQARRYISNLTARWLDSLSEA